MQIRCVCVMPTTVCVVSWAYVTCIKAVDQLIGTLDVTVRSVSLSKGKKGQ